MKKPLPPPPGPPFDSKWVFKALAAALSPLVGGKYLHWDDIRHRTAPDGITLEQWWAAIKERRRSASLPVPLTDPKGNPFSYLLVDPIPEQLHGIDTGAGGWIGTTTPIMSEELRDQYCARSLMEEAITSSQIEGAATTRKVAKDMIRTGRKPRDRSEQMILNNYETMQRLRDLQNEALTPELVFEVHRLITHDTLDDPGEAGRLRRRDEHIVVADDDGTIYHDPPPAEQLPARMKRMCEFANAQNQPTFVHPALRSIILHFWLAYDHPFVDGNGRTARALFYWCMLRHKYWLFEFVSISEIILKGPSKYKRAFLLTETDENDLTYFILYHLDVIGRSIESLNRYIQRKAGELSSIETALKGVRKFNHRQRALLAHAIRHPGYRYTIEGHRGSHNVVYQTARADLLALANQGLFEGFKVGKTWYFEPVSDLETRLRGQTLRRRRRTG